MLPTLRPGDLLLVRWRARPALGSVVVVRLPGGRPVSVKRIVARADGGWWVERDSPVEGVDSWSLGALPSADVLGRVRARLWPRPGRVRRRLGPRPGPGPGPAPTRPDPGPTRPDPE